MDKDKILGMLQNLSQEQKCRVCSFLDFGEKSAVCPVKFPDKPLFGCEGMCFQIDLSLMEKLLEITGELLQAEGKEKR